ncbi:MerR family transcriptional regulator [Streptomyces sp. I05A-00742]|uniref:MerR family transcriptional regulator n=1 Tax=Streptomyces sp. I05A-00742 TaxID=2732853 RepID=UPI00148993FA|nr:MerR family transcriptional regulator [Streptomyces sp. I05A-00742]
MTASTTWRVGPLAEACGLTVRTLHHWDTIGLLSPSRRTSGGHREYTEDDLVRLYQVLALRGLGLSLETIGVCLDTGVDPARLVRDHLAEVEASLARLGTLRQRLVRLGDALSAAEGEPSTGGPAASLLLDALRATGSAGAHGEHVLRRHVDADGVGALAARVSGLGPAAHYLLEVEWPELYRRAERLRTEGVPPSDPRVGRLVARMDELGTLFTGGDRGISAGVREAWRDDPAALSGDPDAPADDWRDLSAYLEAARRAAVHAPRPPSRREPGQEPRQEPRRKTRQEKGTHS